MNTDTSSSARNQPPTIGRLLFVTLLVLLAINAGGYGYALSLLFSDYRGTTMVLALVLFATALSTLLVGWILFRLLRSAREISRAASHHADSALGNLTIACEALGAGNFEQPLDKEPFSPLTVRSGGELGEIVGNFNHVQEAIATATAAFENARTGLLESYRSLWENNDALGAELNAHRESEEKLLKTQKQQEARAGEETRQLDLLGQKLEHELAEHKRTENALQRWEQFFLKAGWGMATINASNDTLLSVNPAFAEMHGYHAEELVGQSLERMVVPEAQVDMAMHASQTFQKKNYSYETLHMRRDGTKFPVLVNATAVTAPGGEVIHRVASFQDITERRQAEVALKAAKEDAEKAIRARSQFLARMSHELRTPLNVILGFSQLLEMNLADSEHQESAQHILKAGKHLLALINEVLDLSRIEAEKISLSLQVIPVGEAMLSAMALVRPSALQREIVFYDQLNSAGVKHVIADNQRLQQIFLNLLSNAVKYNKPGGRITIWCSERAGNKLAICVTDTGSGIPAEKLSQLFTPFERLGADQAGIEGTGLGLALSKKLVELMDGTLEVSSVPGEGSTFSVVLPMASSPVQKLGRLSDERLTSREKSALPVASRMLYIEEDISNVRLVEKLLKPYYKIGLLSAQNSKEGLEMATQQKPDLILLDLDLQDGSGEAVLQKLRTLPETQNTPVVVISADTMPRRIEQMLKQGAAQYLTKPIDVNKLLVVIGESINIRENSPV